MLDDALPVGVIVSTRVPEMQGAQDSVGVWDKKTGLSASLMVA